MMYYHASTLADLRELQPLSKPREGGAPVLYVTPHPVYALFYLRDRDVNWVTCGVSDEGVARYREQCPGQLETLYRGRSGYLYVCGEDGGFEQLDSGVWFTRRPAAVRDAVYVPDVYAAILEQEQAGRVAVTRYERYTAEERQAITDMMVNLIRREGLVGRDDLKARFIRDNFPQAWAVCEADELSRSTCRST